MQAMLPIWLLVIGCITTVFTEAGFIGVSSANKEKVLRYSLYLLLFAMLAAFFAFSFRGNMIIAGILPFVLLKTLQEKFRKQIS